MKRLFIILTAAMFTVGVMAQLRGPIVTLNDNLHNYKYAYIMPAGGITSNAGFGGAVVGTSGLVVGAMSGSPTKTVNPSETISGRLMQLGYTITPSVVPELAEQTMIVTYGHAGKRQISKNYAANVVMIQITNGKTHDVITTIEAEASTETATDDISAAIESAMDLFEAYVSPNVSVEFIEQYNTHIHVYMKNKTPNIVHSVTLQVNYYLNGNLVHSQITSIDADIAPRTLASKNIKRDKQARSVINVYHIECEVIDYK